MAGTKREITCEIVRHIDAYDESRSWHGEVNLISWNGAEPKIDIRAWNDDHTKCSKGISLTIETARYLGEILIRIPDDINEIEE